MYFKASTLENTSDELGGLNLFETDLRVLVDVPPTLLQEILEVLIV